jgi:hypothetical protein
LRTLAIPVALVHVLLCPLASAQWVQTNGPYGGPVSCFAISGTNLFAGTEGGGVWRRRLADMTAPVAPTMTALASEFQLRQNYPNPFNPSTTIRYGLPNRSHVTLTVYSSLGQQVALLQNGELEAGYHEVKFDGNGLSSGVYFYTIEAGSFVQTRRLLLLR